MPLKPLTASQKKVLDAVARIHIYEGMERNVDGMAGFKARVMKTDHLAGQVERYLKKSVDRIRKDMLVQLRQPVEKPEHG